eukprot:6830013-Alexandrium_andersonii.AAC.1
MIGLVEAEVQKLQAKIKEGNLQDILCLEPRDWKDVYGKELPAMEKLFNKSVVEGLGKLDASYSVIWRMNKARNSSSPA